MDGWGGGGSDGLTSRSHVSIPGGGSNDSWLDGGWGERGVDGVPGADRKVG